MEEIDLTMEDVKSKRKFKRKIKDIFVREMSKELKKYFDEQDEKFLHGDPKARVNYKIVGITDSNAKEEA